MHVSVHSLSKKTIGRQHAETVHVQIKDGTHSELAFEITSSAASAYDNPLNQAKYAHLNLRLARLPRDSSGILAELAGTREMRATTRALVHQRGEGNAPTNEPGIVSGISLRQVQVPSCPFVPDEPPPPATPPPAVPPLSAPWIFAVDARITSAPVFADGNVYVRTDSGNVYCIDSVTGIYRWVSKAGAGLALIGPAVANGTVYVGGNDGYLRGLDAATGVEQFNLTIPHAPIDDSGYWCKNCVGTPLVSDGVVYTSIGRSYVAVDLTPGSVRTKWAFSDKGYAATPAVVDGVVYFVSSRGITTLDAETGAQIWAAQVASRCEPNAGPEVAAGKVFFGCNDGKVYAVDAASGSALWSFSTGSGKLLRAAPTYADGVVYVGGAESCAHGYPGCMYLSSAAHALDATTGVELWRFPTGGYVGTKPAIVDGIVYFASYDRQLYAVNATSGVQKWMFRAVGLQDGYCFEGSPTVANGLVYIGSWEKNFYAIDAETGTVPSTCHCAADARHCDLADVEGKECIQLDAPVP